MGSEPLISVCIPSYNSEDFIAATLKSVLDQTYRNLEIIVIDDRSPDGTAAVVKTFTDPRIKFSVNERNLGICGNWRKALASATGKHVKLLCGDDLLYPECIRKQAQILENPSHAGVTLAICGRDVIDSNNDVVLQRRVYRGPGRHRGAAVIRDCVRRGANLIGEPAVGLFRREALGNSPIFDDANPYMVDMDLWAELLRQGDAFVDAERLAAFRISPVSVTTRVGFKQAAYQRAFFRKIHGDPAYGTTGLDVLSGNVLSFYWSLLRNLVIKAHARKARRSAAGAGQPAQTVSKLL